MTSFDSTINELVAGLRQQFEGLARFQESAQRVSGSANSPRHELAVTVDSRGVLQTIRFNGSSYRKMAPEQLAAMIVDTVRLAQYDARRATFEYVGDIGLSEEAFHAMADGSMDWRDALGGLYAIPQPLVDILGTTPDDLRAAHGFPPAPRFGPDPSLLSDSSSTSDDDGRGRNPTVYGQSSENGGARP
jgi:hypothetical protein